jgi:2,3-bisphosphoglycerate-independent phosphoglycerate mutase
MSAARKCLLILLDGLADRAQEALGGRTPLMAAATPHLDRLAAGGACGRFHAASPGLALSSEAAHFLMMGCPPDQLPGRGALEALGRGVELAPGEVALLAHLAAFQPREGELAFLHRSPALPAGDAAGLMEAARGWQGPEGTARLEPVGPTWGILVLSGPSLSPCITDSDPLRPGRPLLLPQPWAEAAEDPAARAAARLLAGYLAASHRALEAHPVNRRRRERGEPAVNGVVTQRAGRLDELPPLELRWGLRVLSLASAPIYRGVFAALGARAELVEEGPDPEADLAAKLALAWERLEDCDLIHLHTKAPDEAAHAKDPAAKAAAIAALDRALAGLAERAREAGVLVVVTGDHATPSSGEMVHSGEPSPLILWGPGVWRDGVAEFSEAAAGAGSLGLLRGPELMQTILSGLDRAKLQGLRDHPQDLPYHPGPGRAFRPGRDG